MCEILVGRRVHYVGQFPESWILLNQSLRFGGPWGDDLKPSGGGSRICPGSWHPPASGAERGPNLFGEPFEIAYLD
jgi:hypothetical protein